MRAPEKQKSPGGHISLGQEQYMPQGYSIVIEALSLIQIPRGGGNEKAPRTFSKKVRRANFVEFSC